MKKQLKVKMILPSLTEAKSKYWRPIKYSLFPPLGLATLAGYFSPDDEIEIVDEHVETLHFEDRPDLVVLQVYITSAYRAYEIAKKYRSKGSYVVMGGLHVTSLPEEASCYADSIFLGPADDCWREFIHDFKHGKPKKIYHTIVRSFSCIPPVRRDLIKRHLYLVPNSMVVSKGCPYNCSFCYKHSFYKGGISYYTKKVDDVLKEIDALPGKHLFFLDDNILGDPKFADMLFDGMKGMKRVWQGAASVSSLLNRSLLKKAADSGLRSLFIGFESLNHENLRKYQKKHNNVFAYNLAIQRLHEHGIMINASFVFGMDEDDQDVFKNTTQWAINQGIETSTFHILTPYPGTDLYKTMKSQDRILTHNWDLYDTRHSVFKPVKMNVNQLEQGYWQAYKDFYRWDSILKGSMKHDLMIDSIKHFSYSAGWKKFEKFWHLIIKFKQINQMIPLLEKILSGGSGYSEKNITSMDIANKTMYEKDNLMIN